MGLATHLLIIGDIYQIYSMQVIYRFLTVSIGCLLYHMHYGYEGRTSTPTSKGIVDSAWCAIAVHKMIIDFFVIFVKFSNILSIICSLHFLARF